MRWGVEWHSANRLDGERRFFMWEEGKPLLFRTRREARDYIKKRYGYIGERKDLQREPHGWRMPQAVPVEVIVRKVER